MEIKRISADDTIPIRQKMLRPGFPIEDCRFRGDEEDQTFHLGAFENGKLVSVASFYFERHTEMDGPYQYRLRGMATLPEYQGRGLSSDLLSTAFPIIKQNFCNLVWCNARLAASGFYQKVGFEKKGEVFEITNVGPHYLMYKYFN